ncbi:ABC transporter substrate-binding protein [Acrocarpospora phusangensis]|uniref:ABC transporter substrate-binding protein n=1 Tax=Acrocarpospora phusangensis TaxID=1070424 RepID=A0A919Q9H3_9ACTN|nr:extracellular solute-binding protein [Acrocarpospora phusangensis]GIH22630.1 ABC transporter substrate-binding protein [Acrocarpospora phusangensis]
MVSRTVRVGATLSTLALLATLAACGGETTPADPDGNVALTFVGYGGVGQQAMIDNYQKPYTAAHPNITFVNTSPPDVAQVKAQVESGSVVWDVVAVAPAAATQNCGTLFEPLDFSGVDPKDLVKGTIGKCYIGNFINASPFAYRTEAFPDPAKAPKTVADFFDVQKFPGQRGILTNLQNGILEYPLLADGVAPDALYPLDADRALKKLDTIRDVTTFAPNVGALQQAVGAKQVDMFFLADSRLVPLMNDGTAITVVWDTTVASINAFAVPKGSPKVKAAQQFMATVVAPQAVAGISEVLGTAPVNLAAKPNLSENATKVQVYGPANTGKTVLQDVDWYAANFNEVTTKLTNWLAG